MQALALLQQRCPSVCPSVTLWYCIKKKQSNKASVMISSRTESPETILFATIRFIPKSERGHPEWGRFMRLGWVRAGDFAFKSLYLWNSARQDQHRYWSVIGSCIRAFDWYRNERPQLTLIWPWTAIMRSVTLHLCLLDPTTKIWMKIDPCCQRQNVAR